jgi:hypothetical protein
MANDQLEIGLIPAGDDPQWETSGYQAELQRFEAALNQEGLEIQAFVRSRKSAEFTSSPLVGDFLVLAKTLGPAAIAAIGGWLAGRNGRKVRIKIGDIEAEARTPEEVEKLLAIARDIKREGEPKRIVHE